MSPLKPHSLTERDLILYSLKGDRDAQRDLFDMYAGKMMTVCRRYGRHDGEAEDILQEGFIKVFLNLKKYKFEGSFEGWIRRIIVNTALKYVSKSSFKKESYGIESYQLDPKPYAPKIYSKLNVDELMKLIDSLPEGYRLVFNLYAIEGYSHREISKLLKIEEGTSRSQLAKARKLLQKKLNYENNDTSEAS